MCSFEVVFLLTYLNTRKLDFYMEYRNTTKTKSETRKSVSAAMDFGVVLNMFTIPKVMFSKILQIFFCKIL